MRGVQLLVIASVLAFGPGAARAQAEGEAPGNFDARVSAALDHYRAGEYRAAVEDFEAAYAIDARPELIYNIARSYEKALLRDEAISTYERFVELPGTTAELRSKALDALEALRRERAALERAEASPPLASETPSGPTAPASNVATTAARSGGSSRALEWTLLGGGAAVAGAGAVFGLLALDEESKLEDARARGADASELQDLADTTERNALVADVLYGVGAASALTGIILFLATGDGESDMAVGPQMLGDGGGLRVSGRF